MPSQGQVVTRIAIQANEAQHECRRDSGHDGRAAVVTRITAALMLGFIRLYCGPCHDLGLAWHLQCVGCDNKILWASVGLSLGLIGTCWSSLVDAGLVSIWRERSAEPIMMAGKLHSEVRNVQVFGTFWRNPTPKECRQSDFWRLDSICRCNTIGGF